MRFSCSSWLGIAPGPFTYHSDRNVSIDQSCSSSYFPPTPPRSCPHHKQAASRASRPQPLSNAGAVVVSRATVPRPLQRQEAGKADSHPHGTTREHERGACVEPDKTLRLKITCCWRCWAGDACGPTHPSHPIPVPPAPAGRAGGRHHQRGAFPIVQSSTPPTRPPAAVAHTIQPSI